MKEKTMTKQLETMLSTMPACGDDFDNWKDYDNPPPKIKPSARIDDNVIYISAENGDGIADYWGEFNDPMFINADLQKWADQYGCYIEWVNPGILAVYPL